MIAARQGVIAKQGSASPYVDITLYSTQGPSLSELVGYSVFYSTENCDAYGYWTNDCFNKFICTSIGTLSVLKNTTFYITVKNCDGTFINYNAVDNTPTCPANEGNYCWDYNLCEGKGVFSFNSGTVNKNIAICVFVSDGDYQGC